MSLFEVQQTYIHYLFSISSAFNYLFRYKLKRNLTYDAGTASVETSKYSYEEFCNSLAEKDKLFCYDLFPFINMLYNNDDVIPSNIDDTFKIMARGNLHVL